MPTWKEESKVSMSRMSQILNCLKFAITKEKESILHTIWTSFSMLFYASPRVTWPLSIVREQLVPRSDSLFLIIQNLQYICLFNVTSDNSFTIYENDNGLKVLIFRHLLNTYYHRPARRRLKKYSNVPFHPHTYFRYIDDIFMIWTEGLDNLKIFIDYLNNIHPTIKFISSHSSTNIPFFDVNVSLTNDGNISTDLCTKPTDKHQHLLYSSCHPLHTKKAIPFSLALRLRRICSTDETFNTRTAQLTTYLIKRGYKRNFVTKQIQRAADIPSSVALQTKDVNKPTRIPFITTFNPSLPHMSNIIKRHYNLLLSSDRCKQIFLIYLLWPSDGLLTSVIYLLQLTFLLTRLIPTHNSLPALQALSVAKKIAPLPVHFPWSN